MLENLNSAIVAVDKNLKVNFVNSAFLSLFEGSARHGKIGKVTACQEDIDKCGFGAACKDCSLALAFEDAFYSGERVHRRIYQRVKAGKESREVSYSVSITPISDNLCMGVIDDAVELELARELKSAQNIQQKLLPAGKWVAGKRYAYTYIPCHEIGGDLPEVYAENGSAYGVICDVSGKGVAAGMLSAFVKAAYDKKIYSPAEAIKGLCDKFQELNLDETNYVTAAAVRIDKDSITYSMAAHNVPILLKTDSGITRIMLNSPPISNWFENPSFFEDTINYKHGDILVLLTDGVTECRNFKGEMFGADGAIKTLSYSKTADDFVRNLEFNLNKFSGGKLSDDVTVIAFDL